MKVSFENILDEMVTNCGLINPIRRSNFCVDACGVKSEMHTYFE